VAPPGERAGKKMLKMKIDPDELLKTKGSLKWRTIDPDEYLKINWLRDFPDDFMICKELAVNFHRARVGRG
jgi:hypothetical protein